MDQNKGLSGLANLGNTCFMNSCMQVLKHTYELNEFLDSPAYTRFLKKTIEDSAILTEWNDLRALMWSGNGVVTPNKFVHNVHRIAGIKKKDIFTGFAQNDMPEFLLFMMDCMHNSICRPVKMHINGNAENTTDQMAIRCYEMLKTVYSQEYSEIMELFYGVYVSEILSLDGSVHHVMKPENYFMLDLPILDGTQLANHLYDCFDMFSKEEILEGENAWMNEKTGQKENIKKRISFWNFPKVLVIALKRFTPDGQYKINQRIDFPVEEPLDLSKYVHGYNAASYQYELYGICNHMGGPTGGHYTAFVKNSENKWIHFNDRSVETVGNPKDMITPLAYCLFYRKKNNFL
jgi:ubiquitin carboxyl-terminal hydrolase 8